MVKENPRTTKKIVAFPVVHRDPVTVDLGHPIGAARVKRGGLALRHLHHLAEHLAAASLIEANLGIDQANRLQHARHAQRRKLAGQHRLVKTGRHKALRRQIVDFGGAVLMQNFD